MSGVSNLLAPLEPDKLLPTSVVLITLPPAGCHPGTSASAREFMLESVAALVISVLRQAGNVLIGCGVYKDTDLVTAVRLLCSLNCARRQL